MKKRNKNIIIIAVLILIFSAIAIVFTHFYSKNKIEQIEKEALETKKQELIDEYEAKEQFIGIDECFLGTVNSEGIWKSANEYTESDNNFFKLNTKINVEKSEITADEIIQNEYFYLYDENEFIGKEKDVFYDKDLDSVYYTGIKYFRFNSFKYYNDDNYSEKNHDNFLRFATSKMLDSNYSNRVEYISKNNFEEYEKYVKPVLEDRGIDSEVNINKVLLADSDLDGNDEIYILANSKYNSDYMQTTNGIYSLVLKVQNNETKVIIERIIPKENLKNYDSIERCFEIYGLNLVDFNNDGKKEIVIYSIVWDIPEIFVITLNDVNEEELCLYGDFAW